MTTTVMMATPAASASLHFFRMPLFPPSAVPRGWLHQLGVRHPPPRASVRRGICSSKLTIERTTDGTRFQRRPAKEELVFGTTLSDHMLMIEWDKLNQWSSPRIVPYQDLKLSPAASALHYGLQAFEGLKAYRSLASHGDDTKKEPEDGQTDDDNNNNNNDNLLMFRPDMNMKRLQASMERLHLPGSDFDHSELLKCIYQLVKLDQKWIPRGEGYSLYIRPAVIGTHRFLGVAPPDSILLFVITSPVGPYYASGFRPIKLTTDSPYVRAWPGGTGAAKVGGNYAPTMKAQYDASQQGYSQILWLYGDDDEITEVGAMNVFFFLLNKDTNRPELVTPPLTRGDILPGVTRDSILHLAKSWGEFDVSERSITMHEVAEAADDNRLLEVFGAGTAAVVSPVSAIQYHGRDIPVPTSGTTLTQRIWDEITGIQYGKRPGPDGWSVKL